MSALIDPRIARAVARRASGSSPVGRSHLVDSLRRDLDRAVPRAEALVAEASGIKAPPPVEWMLIDRFTWADTNITGLSELISPLADKLEDRLAAMPMTVRLAQRGIVSVEVGALLGYVSRRVLGQYDVLVPETGSVAGNGMRPGAASLYFVGPNMVETERRLGFVPRDFTLWVALHEVTHRFQFAGVEWLRPHFFGLVGSYLKLIELDARGLATRLGAAATRLASRSTPVEERNPVYLFASDEQRGLLDQLQALMAVVEGHGNFVMDTVGARTIPSFRRMRFMFQKRREQTGAIQKAISHAIGLEMKLRQYELGQSFCDQAVAAAGPDVLAKLWVGPEALPTLDELRFPERWLTRVA